MNVYQCTYDTVQVIPQVLTLIKILKKHCFSPFRSRAAKRHRSCHAQYRGTNWQYRKHDMLEMTICGILDI